MTDYVLGRPEPPQNRLGVRFGVFGLIVVLVVGALSTRLFYMQAVQGGYYSDLADANQHKTLPIKSSRGIIYDRAGRELAINIPSYVVYIRPADLPFSQRDAVADELGTLVGVDPVEIIAAVDKYASQRFELVRIASDISSDAARIIVEESANLPGVEIGIEDRREYEYGALLSHVLGYTSPINADQLDQLSGEGYLPDDRIGQTGVEAKFEDILRGTYGQEQVERDASGRIVRTIQIVQQAQAGNSLELTIDTEIQREATEALQWATDIVGLQHGVIIVANPQTGEILGMVSLPTYDDNMFARGITNAEYQSLIDDPNHPLVNYAISEQYPPGSTYKLVTASGGLMDRVITPTSILETAGYLEIGPYKYRDWNPHGFGPINVTQAYAVSSDTFFYQVAGMLGADRLAYWADQWGFGKRTGIDLPAEARGIIPTNAWKQATFGQDIFPGEVYHAGIGQGYDAVTPLQLLNAYCALANGGTLYRPQIVHRVLAPDGTVVQDFQPQVQSTVGVDPNVLTTMRLAAREVVTSRHSGNLVDLPLVVAGKTGTAEFGTRDPTTKNLPWHSWFVAFVPNFTADQPGDPAKTDSELAIVAFAYDAVVKANAATEMVKFFLQQHYHLGVDLTRPDLMRDGY
ncbi:MAG TPA: penicillin-binding protein 2, partial [Candidatus Limnocylindria bacterium]|nr:penicillin-binding protein 2 [Candidatus Limnocylindria bacterium]